MEDGRTPITGVTVKENSPDATVSPLRQQAADALRPARKLPIGHERNDLRQLALGLRWLDKRKIKPSTLRLKTVLTKCGRKHEPNA